MKFHKYRENYIQNKVEKFRLNDVNKLDSMKLVWVLFLFYIVFDLVQLYL